MKHLKLIMHTGYQVFYIGKNLYVISQRSAKTADTKKHIVTEHDNQSLGWKQAFNEWAHVSIITMTTNKIMRANDYSLNTHVHLPHLQITKETVSLKIKSKKQMGLFFDFKSFYLETEFAAVFQYTCFFLISDIWSSRCGCTLPLHPNQPRQSPLPCAHADPRSGEWG